MNKNGLVSFKGKMPCSPSEVKFFPYILPGLLGKAETEEAAARLVSYSKHEGVWVGVSWNRLIIDMQKDLDDYRSAENIRIEAEYARLRQRQDDKEEFERNIKRYKRLRIITLGVYAFFAPKPQPKIYEDKHKTVESFTVSVIPVFGIQSVLTGLRALVDLKLIRVGKNGSSKDVFFPSPMLVQKIMNMNR